MRRVMFFFWLAEIVSPLVLSAQYSNSWINFNQSYYKIPVAKEGIYRLTYANLQAVGFPVGSADPRFVKLYHRGQEQAINVKSQLSSVFSPGDYIEFYGQKNDGTLDSLLYRPSSLQPHKYYNLYSDTTAYFLTYSLAPPRGLRMDANLMVNVNNLPAETYQYSQRLIVNHDQYSAGLTLNDVTQSTYFDQGEGWTGVALQQTQSVNYIIDSLFNGVSTAGNPKLELLLVGRDYVQHSLQVNVGTTGGSLRSIASPSFSGFQTYLVTADLNWTDIGADGKLVVQVVASAASTNRYQASVSYIKVTFPQSYNFLGATNKKFTLAVNPGGQSYLSATNPSAGLRMFDITDIQNIVQVLPTSSSPTFNAVVAGTSAPKTIFVSSGFFTPAIIPVSFRVINPANSNYMIITNKVLQQPALGYSNPVQAYAGYRASVAGGGYDTLVVNIDQLYNQFNYGETSPAAIYSFMNFMVRQGNVNYLFLIGKGRDILYSAYQRLPVPPTEYRDLVPSAGYPGGDAAFTAHLGTAGDNPAVATGRLTATNATQVAAYLNKIIEHESKPLQPWMKNILHLSGGGYDGGQPELAAFRQIMDGFAAIARGPYLGGQVSTISKTTTDVQKINVSTSVNQGVNLVTFFGHSSSSTIDIDIGNVDNAALGYSNKGKYPVFLINGCNAGTVFANEVTFGEDWLLAANLGSRNFIGSTSFGYSNELQYYSDLFYSVGFGDSTFIQKGIGDIQKELCIRFLTQYGVNMINVCQIHQMVLSGDPAIKLFGTGLPDYAVDNGSLSVTSLSGTPVTSLSPSFALKIIVKNLGATNAKPLRVRVIRTFNDNSTKTYDSLFSPVSNTDTLTFILKKDPVINGFGNNLFTVVLDPLNAIKEISKANNTATLSYFMPSNGTLNLYPPDFGIVGTGSVNLLFQDANLLGQQRNFIVQVDTVSTFNSSFLHNQTVSGKVLTKMPISLLPSDSVVYYWRTKPAKLNASDSTNWTTSSFIVIHGSNGGWAQTQFSQLIENTMSQVSPDFSARKINFTKNVTQVSVKSIGSTSPSPFSDASIQINGVEYDVGVQVVCRPNTINLVAFNRQTALPYAGVVLYNNDPRGCGLFPSVINSFLPTELEAPDGINLINYVSNVGAGDSVILFSVGNAAFSTWSSNVLSKLNELGIANSQITSLQDGEPVIIRAKKNAPVGTAQITRSPSAPSTSANVAVAGTVTGGFSSGYIKSPLIGPAKKWNQFVAHAKSAEASDHVVYSIFGETLSGQETLLSANAQPGMDLSFIDPVQYPQLKIQTSVMDTVNLTAPQLRNWFILYDPVADGLLFYRGPAVAQTVQQGQVFNGQYGFVNISSQSFSDSLLVLRTVKTQATAVTETQSFKIAPPSPGDTTKFTVAINTVGKGGLNDVTVYVNPKILPEQYYENNVIALDNYLNVLVDKTSPALDVTVDGRYLQNGDFVSPNPVIRAMLIDNNPFLMVQDTLHMNLFLSYPCADTSCNPKRINFSRADVSWTPASPNSYFTVSFHPTNLPEGQYILQATGSNASGNMSGAQPYSVSFQIKDATALILNSVYPNPSGDLFNFNFLLSGNVLPDDFSLQIFSDEGKLLEQFGIKDIGRFIIGNNILPWSAGQANISAGLLVFRMTVTVNGKTATQTGKLVFTR
ncbi:MAG: hypothetical protein OJF59_000023 [Cytophagales bacterium]|nr:hypothetical protein [Bacteroidota bacterium]WHZ06271.1 MAG: hypothetical protein OJF59_000023 [Cytophagales bacterium]